MSRIAAVIPARGGSKTIKRKNIKPMLGKPLVYYSITAALKAATISEVYVSTEDREIAQIAKSLGAEIIERPPELATDYSSTFDVVRHAETVLGSPDIIVILQPTSPLRNEREIDEAVALLDDETDTVVGCCELKKYIWESRDGIGSPLFSERLPRQQMEEKYFENGAIYVTRPKVYRGNDYRLGMGISSKGRTRLYIMDEHHAFDIDTEVDWKITEQLLRAGIEAGESPQLKESE